MAIKLTLALDEGVIDRAKQYARKKNTSISKLVENFLGKVAGKEENSEMEISPLVKKLSGVLVLPDDFDPKKEYRDHLLGKFSK
jgi:hypothetical protein